MKFGIVYYGTEARDRGLDQLAQSLRQLGHDPMIVNRAPRSGQGVKEFNGTPVIQVPRRVNTVSHLLAVPFPFNRLWVRKLFDLGREQRWDGLFVRESPLGLEALTAARKLEIPVFLDMRENLVAMYSAGSRFKSYRKLLRPKRLIRFYESLVCKRIDHIFVVSHELGQWMAAEYSVEAEKVSTLSNYPSNGFLQQANEAAKKKKSRRPNPIPKLIHAGDISENRGLQDILAAMRILEDRDAPVFLRVIGKGAYLEELKRLTRQFNLESRVDFLPMQPPAKVADALSYGDIGVCAYTLNRQAHQTLPGKLWEYMAVGLPVLTSARKPVVRIVEKEKCGIIYSSAEPAVIADAIAAMTENTEQLQQMGEQGRTAILERYNQEHNLETLERVFEEHINVGAHGGGNR